MNLVMLCRCITGSRSIGVSPKLRVQGRAWQPGSVPPPSQDQGTRGLPGPGIGHLSEVTVSHEGPSSGPMDDQGRAVGNWTLALLWHCWGRSWWPQGADMGLVLGSGQGGASPGGLDRDSLGWWCSGRRARLEGFLWIFSLEIQYRWVAFYDLVYSHFNFFLENWETLWGWKWVKAQFSREEAQNLWRCCCQLELSALCPWQLLSYINTELE